MSGHELREWMAFASSEPFGETRADIRAAVIAREVRLGMTASRQHKYTLLDFMPIEKALMEKTERDDAQALSAKINAFFFSRPNVIIKQRPKA
jgi:Protein of unknown function (DUF4035)